MVPTPHMLTLFPPPPVQQSKLSTIIYQDNMDASMQVNMDNNYDYVNDSGDDIYGFMEDVFDRMHAEIEEFLNKTPMCEGVKLKYNYSIGNHVDENIEEVFDERKTRSSSISSASSADLGKKRKFDNDGVSEVGGSGSTSGKLRRSSRISSRL